MEEVKIDKEKLVHDLVNTFNDRNELHEAYKEKMKKILQYFSAKLLLIEEDKEIIIGDFIDEFVEETFKPDNSRF